MNFYDDDGRINSTLGKCKETSPAHFFLLFIHAILPFSQMTTNVCLQHYIHFVVNFKYIEIC
jgi:hypothetical protein